MDAVSALLSESFQIQVLFPKCLREMPVIYSAGVPLEDKQRLLSVFSRIVHKPRMSAITDTTTGMTVRSPRPLSPPPPLCLSRGMCCSALASRYCLYVVVAVL